MRRDLLKAPMSKPLDSTRIMDLTVGELRALIATEVEQALKRAAPSPSSSPSPWSGAPLGPSDEGLIDTWEAAALLGLRPRTAPGPSPGREDGKWPAWNAQDREARRQVGHLLTMRLSRDPKLAALVLRIGERRYFRRAELLSYIAAMRGARRPSR